MITLYAIGIVMFVLQIYILKHTHYVEKKGQRYKDYMNDELEPLKTPMFVIILMALCTLIPYAWTVSTFIFWFVWLKRYFNPEVEQSYNWYIYWRLRDNFLMKTI